ncbi:hypothetical protein [Mesobacillus zeae]|uniref:hypothetical protein n=1 Tax=Mesobacillus zeae TaxID=1917180 RepID=UPI00300A6FA8
MNLTFDLKYNVQQVNSNISHHHIAPLFDLTDELERELNLFYNWSLNQVFIISQHMKLSFFPYFNEVDQEYFEELAEDCREWYLEEGKELFLNFKRKLSNSFFKAKRNPAAHKQSICCSFAHHALAAAPRHRSS